MLSLDRSKNNTSVALDLLRALAAQMVCVGHALSFFASDWRPADLAYMQNVGVLLFFLISGFLITYTLIERSKDPRYNFGKFCVERFARIYSGLIPALALVIVVDSVVIHYTNDPNISRYFTLKTLIANLFMFEGYRGILANYLQWSAFGSAAPLWTLAIEWQIYMFAGALFFMVKKPTSIPYLLPFALFFGQTPVHFLLGAFQADGVGKGLFSLWLGGALVYFIVRVLEVGFLPAFAIGLCCAAIFLKFTHAGAEYQMSGYPFLALFFFGIVAATQAQRPTASLAIGSWITFVADYSFSLYLIHHTIMYAMWTMSPARGLVPFAIAIGTSNLVAIGLAQIGEKHHRALAKVMKDRLLAGRLVLEV